MLKLFEFLTIFDWISPLSATLDDVMHIDNGMDVWTFFIPFKNGNAGGRSTFEINALLAQYGIQSWGGLLFNGEYQIKVKLVQARWAEYILNQNGIEIADRCSAPPSKGDKLDSDLLTMQHSLSARAWFKLIGRLLF